MQSFFDKGLISEAIAYFTKRFDTPVSEQEAESYLMALSELVLVFEDVEAAEGAPAVPARRPLRSSRSLILDSLNTLQEKHG